MTAVRPLEVLVVGAGLAGLALCVGLGRLGARITLVELEPAPLDMGAGLLLTGNGLRVLDAFGLGDAARGVGRRVDAVCFADASGAEQFRLPIRAPWPEFLSLHRARLRRLLLDAARPVEPRWGVRVVRLENAADGVLAELSDGDRRRFDLVVGADGVHGATREMLFGPGGASGGAGASGAAGTGGAEAIAGFRGWRFVCAGPVRLEDPVYLVGNGRTLLLHPLADGEIYCGAGPVACTASPDEGGEGNPRAALMAAFAGFGGPARAVLDALDDSIRLIPTRYWEVELPRWSRGHGLLIGDAAHASAPTLAQGASMAFEDAAVLCEELAAGGPVPEALVRFEQRRRPRIRATQREARARMEANRPVSARQLAVRDQVLRRFGRQQLEAAWGWLMNEMP